MFDGNFRSTRREVNLSTGGRRRGGTSSATSSTAGTGRSRNAILRDAQAQRKQRQEVARREKAARLFQKLTRGFLTRLRVVQDLATAHLMDMNTATTALSLCLSFRSVFLAAPRLETSRKALLLRFQRQYHSSTTDDSSDGDDGMTDASSSSYQWFSQRRIVSCTLEELNSTDTADKIQCLFGLLQSLWETTRVDDALFLTLTRTCQKWHLGNQSTQQRQVEQSSPGHQVISHSLVTWAIRESDTQAQQRRRALLATIVLGGPIPQAISYTTPSSSSTKDQFDAAWFGPLVDTIVLLNQSQSEEQHAQVDQDDILRQATIDNLRNGTEERLLSNLLELTTSPRLLVVLHHVLSQPQNFNLKLAVALLVRGETLVDGGSDKDKADKDESNHDDFDEDDLDTEEGPEDSNAATSNQQQHQQQHQSHNKKARGPQSSYNRKELLTLAKLDKLYHERIQEARKATLPSFDATVQAVAKKIVLAPWVEWGIYLLHESNCDGIQNYGMDPPDLYVETLGFLMQANSALRSKMKLGVLSPVAFSKTILDALWRGIQKDRFSDQYLAHTLFADLFSHYLTPLSDLDFVRLHIGGSNGGQLNILAKDLVTFYQSSLYEVYWTKPILANEVQMDNARGRLILSGTKLWNSLYERWNRLVRNSFCEEEQWWFPQLSSLGNDRAVVPARERMDDDDDDEDGSSEDDNDDDDMDVDDGNNYNDRNDDTAKAEAESDALADSFRDPKMARVLTSIPQALPFDRRVKLFHSLIKADKQKTLQAAASRRAMMAMAGQRDDDPMAFFDGGAREQVKIRRADLYADSMEQLNGLGSRLKNQIQVTFVNQHGTEEAGIDGGGVFKEFLDDLIKDAFVTGSDENKDTPGKSGPQLFVETPVQTLAVNLSLPFHDSRILSHYSFLGRVLGKAVYESILVEPQFALPFLNQCLGKTNAIEDLKNYDEEYYTNLSKLRRFSEEEMELSGLTFELTIGGGGGFRPRTVELERGGRSKPVTQKTAFKYTNLVANELLNKQGAEQTKAFLRGFRDLIPVSWVRLFSATELQKLISGDDSIRGIDVPSLRKSMHYLGGYHESQPFIQTFWDVLETEFTPEQQRKFLRFMTSCSRQPLLGFGSLEPSPSIQQIRLRDDERTKNSRLPTSQTCMNLLKLPNYQDRNLLKEKLLAAVEAGAGFELT